MSKVKYFLSFVCCIAFFLFSFGQSDWTEVTNGDIANVWSSKGKPSLMVKAETIQLSSIGSELGWMISPNLYQDFHIRFSYKLTDGAEGYVTVRTDGDDVLATGYPVHLSNSADQQNPTGSILNLARATWLDDLDVDGWNTMDIIAIGDHLKVLLNQTKVAETHNRRSRAGQIAIAAKGSTPISLRDVQIRTFKTVAISKPLIEDRLLSHPNDYESLFDGRTLNGWSEVGTATWEVTNGIIHGYSGTAGGFICTEKPYHNFHFKSKFKIIKEDNNSVFQSKKYK